MTEHEVLTGHLGGCAAPWLQTQRETEHDVVDTIEDSLARYTMVESLCPIH
jgi:hypothetical protein